MFVHLVELITRPGQAEAISSLCSAWLLPLARLQPGFYEGLCLVLCPEPRMVLVFTRWQSESYADDFFVPALPTVVSMLEPLVDKIAVRVFDAPVVMAAASAA